MASSGSRDNRTIKMNSKVQRMSSPTTDNPCSSSSALHRLHPLNVDIVLGNVFTYLEEHQKDAILNYRLVCHKWNDVIVSKMNRSGRSFRIPIRYGSEVPQFIEGPYLGRTIWPNNTLGRVISILTGTAGRIQFDNALIQRDSYLGIRDPEWRRFWKLQGKSIRHLKLKIGSKEFPYTSADAATETDSEEVLSVVNMRKIFLSTPNLESLEFGVRFPDRSTTQSMFPAGDLPQLEKLTKLTIREPEMYLYTRTLIIEILSMGPNLTDLYLKRSNELSTIISAMSAVESKIKSLTTLQIGNVDSDFDRPLNEEGRMLFSFLNLTTLQINICDEWNNTGWIQTVLHLQHSSLVSLVLGNRGDDKSLGPRSWLTFPPLMEHLKKLEVNLVKFKIRPIESYETRFPVLETLSFTCGGNANPWRWIHLAHLLPGVSGHGTSVKEFVVVGPKNGEDIARIVRGVRDTFPNSESHFDR